MSFSKAKILRFNDIRPCAPAPTAYNINNKDKIKSSVSSQSERVIELRSPSASETGSSHSVPCQFRTPTLPKRKKPTSVTKSKQLFAENVDSEALKEKVVECENKDAFIKILVDEIEELKDKISSLDEQKKQLDLEKQKVDVLNLKDDHEGEIKKLMEQFEESINKVNEEKIKVNDEIVQVRSQYENLKEANRKEMNELKNNCDKFNVLYNQSIEECNKLLDEKNSLLKNREHELEALENSCIQMQRKHSMEIEKLKKEHQNEIQDIEFEILKTMTELQKEKEQASSRIQEIELVMNKAISDLKRKFEQERKQLLLEYEDKVSQANELVKQAHECQMKEKLEEMENSLKKKLECQQQQSDAILKECQTISEYNIIQCELEKKELETKLTENAKELETQMLHYNKMMVNYEDLKKKHDELQSNFSSLVNESKNNNDILNNSLHTKNIEIKKYSEENRAYLITIKNSQNTIEVLKKRLINSDRDVEQLKKEVADNESKLLASENKCIRLMSDLKQAQDYNEELEMQHESAIKLNTSEIQQLKTGLLEKVENYRRDVEALYKKLDESEAVKREIMQQLHEAHEVIEKSKMEFDCFETIHSQYEFEVEQSQNELEDYRIREIDWNNLREKLEHSVKELESILEMKLDEVNDLKNQVSQLQEKCESYFNHSEYYKDKVKEYERELDETGTIHKKYIEQSGKYDELLQKFEQLERENMEKQKEILKLTKNCHEKDNYMEKCNQQKADYEALLRKYEQLEQDNSSKNRKANEQIILKEILERTEQEKDALSERVAYLEVKLKEVSDKYTDLVGHHNNKQKIKHVVDLKMKNEELVQANMDMELKMRSQLKTIEKLKKDIADLKKCVKKSKLHPEDKENVASPNRSLNSNRVESPFRDRN